MIIALAALAVVWSPFLTAMGLGAAFTVLIAVLVALTLLPAILGLVKSKAFAGRVRRYVPRREKDGKIVNNGVQWARLDVEGDSLRVHAPDRDEQDLDEDLETDPEGDLDGDGELVNA